MGQGDAWSNGKWPVSGRWGAVRYFVSTKVWVDGDLTWQRKGGSKRLGPQKATADLVAWQADMSLPVSWRYPRQQGRLHSYLEKQTSVKHRHWGFGWERSG